MDTLTSIQSLGTIPMLDVNRKNWPIFKRKFETFVDSAGLNEHFLEDDIPANQYEDIKPKLIKQSRESNDDLEKHLEDWKKDKATCSLDILHGQYRVYKPIVSLLDIPCSQ